MLLKKVVDSFDSLPITRFIWIVWCGSKVKIFIKAGITTHRGKVRDFMGQSHVTLDAGSVEELSDEIVQQKVSDASGSSHRVVDSNHQRESKVTVTKTQSKFDSGNLTFVEEEKIKEAIENVRSDKEPNDWVFLAYQGNTNNVELVGTGSGGAEELKSHLEADRIGFALVRVQIEVDNHKVTRFALIDFVGEQISTVRKAKTVTFKEKIEKQFISSHVSLQVSSKEEVSEQLILSKVTDIAGVSNKTRDVVSNNPPPSSNNYSNPPPSSSTTKSAPSEKTTSVGKGGASLIHQPKKSGNAVNTASTDLSFEEEESCKNAIKGVRADDLPNNFCLFAFKENNPSKNLVLVGEGSDGVEGLCNAITNEKTGCYYGLLRWDTVVQDVKTVKFVFINFIGEGIKVPLSLSLSQKFFSLSAKLSLFFLIFKVIEKSKITTKIGAVKQLLGQFHTDLHASKKSELSEDSVREKISAVTFSK